jgi:glycerol-3-phosphate cytidylyltransferase-like family protein
MGINERMLNILSLGTVDDIIVDAPYFIDQAFLKDFNISVVAEGCRSNVNKAHGDPFEVPKELDIFHVVQSTNTFTTKELVDRIRSNAGMIRDAVERKKLKQNSYYEQNQAKKDSAKEI